MDFSQADTRSAQDEGRWLTILHPTTDKPTDARLLLAGEESKIYSSFVFKQADRQAREAARKRHPEPDTEKNFEDNLKLLAALTLGTENVSWQGREVRADDKKTLMEFYRAFRRIREQIYEFIADVANYEEVEKKSASGLTGNSLSSSAEAA